MKRQCDRCGKYLGEKEPYWDESVFYGICEDCRDEHSLGSRTVLRPVFTKFYTCWVEGTSGGYGRKHPDYFTACQEAERLARLPENKDKLVYVMGLTAVCQEKDVTWFDVTGVSRR